jgi:hypothetical protein
VHAVDLDRGEVVSSLELDGVGNESVYGIAVVPDGFTEPPPADTLFTTTGALEEAAR